VSTSSQCENKDQDRDGGEDDDNKRGDIHTRPYPCFAESTRCYVNSAHAIGAADTHESLLKPLTDLPGGLAAGPDAPGA
jgi:hypothetical protein